MANQLPVQTNTGPTTVESFIADRMSMWSYFNRLTMTVVVVLVVLLLLLTYFLV